MKPNLDMAKRYMAIDYGDEVVDMNVARAIDAGYAAVLGGVGKDIEEYLPDDPRIQELALIYAEEFYTERGSAGKVGAAVRHKVADLELQLRLELAAAKGEQS